MSNQLKFHKVLYALFQVGKREPIRSGFRKRELLQFWKKLPKSQQKFLYLARKRMNKIPEVSQWKFLYFPNKNNIFPILYGRQVKSFHKLFK